MSLLTHRLVPLCVDAYCFVFWDLPGDVLAAPESALCGWIGVILLSLCPVPPVPPHPGQAGMLALPTFLFLRGQIGLVGKLGMWSPRSTVGSSIDQISELDLPTTTATYGM